MNIINNNQKKNFLKNKFANFSKYFESKIFIATLFLILGILITTSVNQVFASNKNKDKDKDNFDDIFSLHNQFFSDNDSFFSEFEKIEKTIAENHKMMQKHFAEMEKISQNQSKNSTHTQSKISKKEDDKFFYYKLDFTGFKKDEIDVLIEDNLINFLAKKEIKSEDKKSQFSNSSNFYYSLSIPDYDQNTKPEIIRSDNEILVKFAKKNNQIRQHKEQIKG
jgi:HSP20 family molecular chaperone IbpA